MYIRLKIVFRIVEIEICETHLQKGARKSNIWSKSFTSNSGNKFYSYIVYRQYWFKRTYYILFRMCVCKID